MWFWIDGSPNYFNQRIAYKNTDLHDKCIFLSIVANSFQIVTCSYEVNLQWSLCEKEVQRVIPNNQTLIPFELPSKQLSTHYRECEKSHFTHAHLTCDSKSACSTQSTRSHCPMLSTMTTVSVQMFDCGEFSERVHFTQVCDFRKDCPSGQDESGCHHDVTGQGFR